MTFKLFFDITNNAGTKNQVLIDSVILVNATQFRCYQKIDDFQKTWCFGYLN